MWSMRYLIRTASLLHFFSLDFLEKGGKPWDWLRNDDFLDGIIGQNLKGMRIVVMGDGLTENDCFGS